MEEEELPATGGNPDKADYYYTEEGFIVFTASYHLKRGYCCQSGCRHCPYGYDRRTGRMKRDPA